MWESFVENNTVTWTGGPLAPNTGDAFALDVSVDEATAAPGPVQLQAEQLYPGGGKLPWPISLTVVPADDGRFRSPHVGDRSRASWCSRPA